ncbi:MAG TPA: hypothetical protein VNW97_05640 [Candidatus Saccharimonadales bacterium]|jgi:hypothetical protein|nr:hypothetical protein [Candidatus Saccharimonadales bacterium]
MNRIQWQLALFAAVVCTQLSAQSMLATNSSPTPRTAMLTPSPTIQPVITPCAQPAELMEIGDYTGPFSSLVTGFAGKLERKTVHPPSQPSRVHLCSLTARDKFSLFARNSTEPVNFLGAGWDAAWAQLDGDDQALGKGALGYLQRYNAALVDNVSGEFFNTFLYPAIFHQDPRYYRLGQGPVTHRLAHAMRHVFVAHDDQGHLMFNYSEWMGTASSKALGNLYHPGNERGFGETTQRVGMSVTSDMAYDVLKEFWPEISHKFRLPFKRHEQAAVPTAPAAVVAQPTATM